MKQTIPLRWVLLATFVVGFLLWRMMPPREVPTASLPPSSSTVSTAGLSCKVLTVFDGDTLGCDLSRNGRIEKPQELIRLLGIDAPETRHSKKNKTGRDEPLAHEAAEALTRLAQGRTVFLALDEKPRDRYGRLLAFVYREGEVVSLNQRQLAQGLATLLYIPPNAKYQAQMTQTEAQARAHGRGLWHHNKNN